METENICKNCIHYYPDVNFQTRGNDPKGDCSKIEVLMPNKYDRMTAATDDLGNCGKVGENLGCIHFEIKIKST